MNILAVRSIPMSTETTAAWKAAGVDIAERRRSVEQIMMMPYDVVINLGNARFNPTHTDRVINLGTTIKDLVTPGGTRRKYDDLIPPEPSSYPCDAWLKGPGHGGRNKSRRRLQNAGAPEPRRWDIQLHIEGQEYRIITVGKRIVQQFRRNNGALDGRLRDYRWLSRLDTPKDVRKLVHTAAARLESRTIIGWDVILPNEGDNCFLLEGNSCPGVNEATARRIVTELERGHDAE